MTHFIKRCRLCRSIISQCRCPGQKQEQLGMCAKCGSTRCDICEEPIPAGSGSECCGHLFCDECFRAHLEAVVESEANSFTD